ncbi:uncharacterized protein LOC112588724 [Harpegnathos saltator]|uniref:uncharacterized protein LOC112588724 n=1 Tax=Harpegnathos saltator TaxID=610380 RepID=UPI000DBED81B|nr:uncharacterized protein LOC112588724 [Harpegnathos saltator]
MVAYAAKYYNKPVLSELKFAANTENILVKVKAHMAILLEKNHVNLLHISDTRDDNFARIKNLSRLVSSQLSKKSHKKHICDRFLHYFSSSEKLESRTVDYQKMNDCAKRSSCQTMTTNGSASPTTAERSGSRL